MNPTITTGTASYMGVSGPDHHHRPETTAYMGEGSEATTKDTAAKDGRGRRARSTTYRGEHRRSKRRLEEGRPEEPPSS